MKNLASMIIFGLTMSLANADIINHDQIKTYRLTEASRGECSTKITLTRNDLVVQIVYLDHEYETGKTETQELQNFSVLDLGDSVYLKSALNISENQLYYASGLFRSQGSRDILLEAQRVVISVQNSKEALYQEIRDGNGNLEKSCSYLMN